MIEVAMKGYRNLVNNDVDSILFAVASVLIVFEKL